MLRRLSSRLNSKLIDKRFVKNKNHKFETLKKSPTVLNEYTAKKSQLKELYIAKLCGPDKYDILANNRNLLENKKSVIKNNILADAEHKDIVPVDWENSPNSLSKMSEIGVNYVLSGAKINTKDLANITVLFENVPYVTLKKLTENILKRYQESRRPMPLSVYENLLQNYKQNNETPSTIVPPDVIVNDIITLLDFRKQEIESKMAFNVPGLDEAGELSRKLIYDNVLEQLQTSLEFKKMVSPVSNMTISDVGFGGKNGVLTLDKFNLVLSKLTSAFGQCELRSVHTKVLKILSCFSKADAQFEVFSHMKFLSVRNNSPDEEAYASLLDTYIKEKELFKSIDLVEEFKENMMKHYQSIYLMNIGLNQFLKEKIPLLPLHYKDPAHFDNLHKLLDELKNNKGFSDSEILEYYMGVPISLRVKLVKSIVETLKSPTFNDTNNQETLISLKRKAWHICYGIIQELSVSKNVSVSKDLLIESSGNDSTSGLAIPLINHIDVKASTNNDNDTVTDITKAHEENMVLNKVTEEFSYKFTNVLMSLASIDKDIDFARALYSRFFDDIILPRIKNSSDISYSLDYKQRESWAEIFSILMETYGSHENIVKKLDTQTKVTIERILGQGIKLNNGTKVGFTRLYQQDTIIDAMRSKIMNSFVSEMSSTSLPIMAMRKSTAIGFLPISRIEEDEGLRLAESAAIMKWHYFNFNKKNQLYVDKTEVPKPFLEQINTIAKIDNDMEALHNLQLLFFSWYVDHCKNGLLNSAMTNEKVIIKYVEVPKNMAHNSEQYKNRMDDYFIDFTKVFKMLTDYKSSFSPDLLKTLYLESFKSWKAQHVLNNQMAYNVVNNDPEYLSHTWNEQTSLNNLNLLKKMNVEGQKAELVLSDSNHEFYDKYALALLLNDMGTEGFNFIEQTKNIITYSPQTLRYYEVFFFEIEDMEKVAKILEVKKLMLEKPKIAVGSEIVSL